MPAPPFATHMKNLFKTSREQTHQIRRGRIGRDILVAVLAALGAIALVPQAKAQPANNNFTNALVLFGTPGTYSGTSAGATRETNEPIHWVGSPLSSRSVWFSWVAPETGIVTFDTIGSSFDTILAAYELRGTNGLASLLRLANDDDSGSLGGFFNNRSSLIQFQATQGTNYYIAIDGYRSRFVGFSDSGPYTLNWRMGTNPVVQLDTIRFSNPTYTVLENGLRATITVLYGGDSSGGANGPVTVDFSTFDGTATNGIHYTATNGVLEFLPGETTKTFDVEIINDGALNYNRTVFLSLSNPTNAFLDPLQNQALLTITDDEAYTSGQNLAGEFNFSSSYFYGTENETDPAPFGGLAPAVDRFRSTVLRDINLPGVAHRSPYGVVVTVTRTGPRGFFFDTPLHFEAKGRVMVDYETRIRPSTTNLIFGPLITGAFPAKEGIDFTTTRGTLVFDDYQMSASFLIPVFSNFNSNNASAVFDVVLSNPRPVFEELQNAATSVVPVLGAQSTAQVYVLEVNETFKRFNFERSLYRYDEYNPLRNDGPYTNNVRTVVIDVLMPGGGGGSVDVRMLHTTTARYSYELQAGSDYATLTNEFFPNTPYSDGRPPILNESDFEFQTQTLNFPSTGPNQFRQRATFTITNDNTVEFNEDIRFDMVNIDANAGYSEGPNFETTATILFDDQPAGAADREWNPEGVYYTQPSFNSTPGANNTVAGVVVQDDGRSIIVGDFTAFNGVARNRIARLNTDGSLDETFNPGSGANGAVGAVVLYTATAGSAANFGKILVGGNFTAFDGLARRRLARLNADGSLDATFNVGNGANGPVRSIGLQSDGKVIVAGDFTRFNDLTVNGIMRLNEDGSLDETFNPGSGANGRIWSVGVRDTVSPIVVSRRSPGGGATSDRNLIDTGSTAGTLTLDLDFSPGNNNIRVYYDGVRILDYTTNDSAQLVIPYGPGFSTSLEIVTDEVVPGSFWFYQATVQPTVPVRSIYVAGEFTTFNGSAVGHVARLRNDGSLDAAFNPGVSVDGPVYAMLVQPDDRVLIGGSFTRFQNFPRNNLVRLLNTGALDQDFHTGRAADDTVRALTLQPDGKILLGGEFQSYNGTRRMGIARLFKNGALDTSFMDTAYNQFAGLIKTFSFDPPRSVNAIAVQADGNIMIGGSFTNLGGNLSYDHPYFATVNLHAPFTRASKVTRFNVARLIGGYTDGPGNIEFEDGTTAFNVNENSGSFFAPLRRIDGRLGSASVSSAITPNTARIPDDVPYASVATTWSERAFIAPWSIGFTGFRFFQIPIVDDHLREGNETFDLSTSQVDGSVSLGNNFGSFFFFLGGEYIPLGPARGFNDSVRVTIADNDFDYGEFNFAQSDFVVNENAGTATITIIRTNGSAGDVSVRLLVFNGTALAGQDYVAPIGEQTLSFPVGTTTNTFTLTLLDSPLIEPDETVVLVLTNATGNATLPGGLASSTATATVTIIDNDFLPGRLRFSAESFANNETERFAAITVRRVGGSAGVLSTSFETLSGSATAPADFTATNGILSWNSGDATPRTILVPLAADGIVEGPESFVVRLFNPSVAGALGDETNILEAEVTILDGDAYGVLSLTQSYYEADENGVAPTITVVRRGGIGGTVAVDFATTPGSAVEGVGGDYLGTNGTLVFLPGEVSRSFRVPLLDDNTNDGLRTVSISLSNSLNATIGVSDAVLAIIDNEGIFAPAGSLDTTFTTAANANGPVFSLALQDDGAIVMAGSFTEVGTVPRNRLARLLPDGNLDPTFDIGPGADGVIRALALQRDGRLVIGGTFTTINSTNAGNISRLSIDGKVDGAFDAGAGADNPVFALLVQPDDRILVGGAFSYFNGEPHPGIVRLMTNGVVDPTFVTGSGINGSVYAFAVQADGKILVAGEFVSFNAIPHSNLVRLLPDGSLDASFNPAFSIDGAIRTVLVQTDGNIVIGGDFTAVNGVSRQHLARLDQGGFIDNAFLALPGQGADGAVYAIKQQIDGRLIISGDFQTFNGVTRGGITRLRDTDGTTDPSINFGVGANDFVAALLLQPDRKIVLGGGFTEYDGEPREHVARIYGGSISGGGTLEFGQPEYLVSESSTNVVVAILRRGGIEGTASATITTLDGTALAGRDYEFATGTINFPEGETRQTFTVPIIPNTIADGDRVAYVQLSGFVGATAGFQPYAAIQISDDESVFSFSAPEYSVNENAISQRATIGVTRTGGTNSTVIVGFSTANGTALAGADYVPAIGSLVFQPGEQFKNFHVDVIDDGIKEPNETVLLSLTSLSSSGALGVSNAVLVLVDDDNNPGVLTLATNEFSVTEDAGTIAVEVFRVRGNSGQVTVDFQTVSGTASSGLDFVGTNGTLTLADGQTSGFIIIPIIDDLQGSEGDESFQLRLTGATGGATLGLANATITINDNDAPGEFVFSAPTYTVAENAGVAAVTINRINGNLGAVNVTFTTTGGTATPSVDYTPVSTVVNFGPGETVRTINIPLLTDSFPEGVETVGLLLSNESAGTSIGVPGSAVLQIVDDQVSVGFSEADVTVTESLTNVTITVVRSGNTNLGFSVLVNTTDGTAVSGMDYVNTSTTLDFAPGEVSRTFTITVLNDQLADGDEFLNITLSSPTAGVGLGPIPSARLHILDDDTGYNFSSSTYATNESTIDLLVTVIRSGFLGATTTVDYATFDGMAIAGIDYLTSTGRLSFIAGQTSAVFTVRILDDSLVEGNETIGLTLLNPSTNTVLGPQSTAVITILEDDGSVGFLQSSYFVSEQAGTATITLVRRGSSALPVQVSFRTVNGTAIGGVDYGSVNTTVFWGANDVAPKTVVIPIVDDTLQEGAETVNLQLLNPINAGLDPATASAVLTIADDAGSIAFSSVNYSVTEGSGNALLNLVRTGGTNGTVSVQWNVVGGRATPGQDYSGSVGTVVFANGETTKPILISILDDGDVEGMETVLLTLSNPGGGARVGSPGAATLSIIDNDAGIIVGAGTALVAESFTPTNNVIEPSETVTLLFALRNAGLVDANNVTASLVYSNGVSHSVAQIQNYGALAAGGASASRPFTFTALGTNGSIITATLLITNNGVFLGPVSFDFVLGRESLPFENANAITIPVMGPATPYPAALTISGVAGSVSHLTVTLHGLTHRYPDDLDMVLMGPNGQKVMLMSDAGGGNANAMNNVTVTFDDNAAFPIPDQARITNAVYRPANYLIQEDPFPTPSSGPAATPPYGTSLSVFNGINPNGVWRLFIVDDTDVDDGSIARGWSLNIGTGQEVIPGADLGVFVSDSSDPVGFGGTVTYTIALTNYGPGAASSVRLTNQLPPATLVSYSGLANASLNGNVLVGSVGSLGVGAGALVTVTMTAPNSNAQLTYTASAGAGETDFNVANNQASANTTVSDTVVPPLLAARKGGQVVLSWQGTSPKMVLQSASSMTGNWQTSTNAPVITNGSSSVTLPAQSGLRFFRLRAIP